MIYVASPYSSTNKDLIEKRMRLVEKHLAWLFSEGRHALTPLANHYYLDTGVNLPTNYEFWRSFCRDLLRRCDELHVIMSEGWKNSVGVKDEIEFADSLGIPIKYILPELI